MVGISDVKSCEFTRGVCALQYVAPDITYDGPLAHTMIETMLGLTLAFPSYTRRH